MVWWDKRSNSQRIIDKVEGQRRNSLSQTDRISIEDKRPKWHMTEAGPKRCTAQFNCPYSMDKHVQASTEIEAIKEYNKTLNTMERQKDFNDPYHEVQVVASFGSPHEDDKVNSMYELAKLIEAEVAKMPEDDLSFLRASYTFGFAGQNYTFNRMVDDGLAAARTGIIRTHWVGIAPNNAFKVKMDGADLGGGIKPFEDTMVKHLHLNPAADDFEEFTTQVRTAIAITENAAARINTRRNQPITQVRLISSQIKGDTLHLNGGFELNTSGITPDHMVKIIRGAAMSEVMNETGVDVKHWSKLNMNLVMEEEVANRGDAHWSLTYDGNSFLLSLRGTYGNKVEKRFLEEGDRSDVAKLVEMFYDSSIIPSDNGKDRAQYIGSLMNGMVEGKRQLALMWLERLHGKASNENLNHHEIVNAAEAYIQCRNYCVDNGFYPVNGPWPFSAEVRKQGKVPPGTPTKYDWISAMKTRQL